MTDRTCTCPGRTPDEPRCPGRVWPALTEREVAAHRARFGGSTGTLDRLVRLRSTGARLGWCLDCVEHRHERPLPVLRCYGCWLLDAHRREGARTIHGQAGELLAANKFDALLALIDASRVVGEGSFGDAVRLNLSRVLVNDRWLGA